nr:hypothetical protein [Tanacetum cinerariifolium]
MGYGDYQMGNVTILRVYYVEGLGHNLFSVGQFCDSDFEIAFQKNTCFIRNLDSVDLLSGSKDTNLYIISLDDMIKTSPICLLSKALKTKSWLWHRRLSHLNFGKSKKSSHQPKAEDTNQEKLYLLHVDLCGPMRVESINGKNITHQTYVAHTPQQNGIVKRRNWTLVEAAHTMLIFSKAPLFLSAEAINIACYTQNRSLRTRRIVEKIHVDFDELTAMASEQRSSRPALKEMTTGTIIPEAIAPIIEVIPPVNADSTVIPQDVGDDNLDMEVAQMGNDPLFSVPIPEVTSVQSTTLASPQAIVHTNHPMPHHNSKWTKDHPLNNIIGQLSRPVSTRLQLHEKSLFCYYDAFLTSVERKTYKEALTQSCWIEAMQEEL